MSATTTTSILIAAAVLCCVGLRCSAFTTTKVVVTAIRSSSKLSRLSGATRDFLHESEYPGDDFTHILGFSDSSHEPSKLQQIASNTLKDVKRNKTPVDTDGCGIDRSFYISASDMEQDIRDFDEKYGKPLNLGERIASTFPKMAVAAEFKRASPSKGDINPGLDAVTQCMEYARVGAAVISVLTEFKWFKGTLTDMKRVRLATQAELGVNRPAILRKDFILDRYQVLEARVHGADTLLLIVAILGVQQLTDLMQYSRSLGMEPLVEVHTDREMEIALQAGAKVIGVNNRNLHTFKLDLDTTERAIGIAKSKGYTWQLTPGNALPDIMIAALSGITSSDDVSLFRKAGVSCVLVGETLMKSSNPKQTIAELLGEVPAEGDASKRVLVKTCGVTSASDAEAALQAGASFIGVIFAKSPRSASIQQAKEIVEVTRKYGERSAPINMVPELERLKADRLSTKLWYTRMQDYLQKTTLRRPLVVGVFQGQTVEEMNDIVQQTGIDIAQLHGEESVADLEGVTIPCIKVLHMSPSGGAGDSNVADKLKHDIELFSGKAVAILLDSRVPGTAGGGTGAVFDWSVAGQLNIPVILAGGLTPDNVGEAAVTAGVMGVDVSSGIEQTGKPGVKDVPVMKSFIANARS